MHNACFFVRYKLHHVLFWMLVAGLWFSLRQGDYASDATTWKVTIIKVIDLAILVYITNYILLPQLFYKKKYVLFFILFLLMIVVSSYIKMQILGRVTNNPRLLDFFGNWRDRVYDNMVPHFFLVTAGAAAKLMFDYTKMQQRLVEVAKEKAETELSFLKSQINPHFLFNSLNSVYFLINKDNPEARQALHKFSEMLRYQLYEMGGDRIPIEKEIHYLKDYVDLQQLRKDEKYKVDFNCSPDVKGFSIEPLLLVPFVENAFKHLSHHNDQTNFIRVDLSKQNGSFQFIVENSKEQIGVTHSGTGGIGLPNVRRRLELLYPGRYDLNIRETDQVFSVHLNLQLS